MKAISFPPRHNRRRLTPTTLRWSTRSAAQRGWRNNFGYGNQISNIFYTEAAKNPVFEESYYQSHLPVLQSRIEKAGIRIAGVLNGIFDATQHR